MTAQRPHVAAFFDLDRTLLAGASAEVFSAALKRAGLVGRSIPGEALLYQVFNVVGETLPSMALARQAAALAKGRSRGVVAQACADAVDDLVALVQPGVADLLASHRAEGRLLVLATTTPDDMVRPFAERLGFDDVVATRYGVAADGTYDGSITGHFVWSAGKLNAVRDWSAEHGVDVGASWAYSDSIYDTPLLAAVGHPVAVNPDPRMAVMAAARRWPVLDLSGRSPEGGVPRIPIVNLEIQRVALAFAHPALYPYVKFDIDGIERIPVSGPVILVGNHRSYFDVAAIGVTIARSGRTVRFLGKKEVFDAPVVGQIAAAMGGIRVDRGTGSDEPLQAAAEALERGEMVAMMPQGTIPRGRAFFDPVLRGRWGVAKLAALTKAPVVPVGLWGTERVWPRSARVPAVWNVLDPPTVRVRVGDPVPLKHRSPDADTKRIMQALVDLLPAEARVHREPTPAEIALTLPPGYRGDPDHEVVRRPGTD